MADSLDRIPELIDQGEKFAFINFASMSQNGYPSDWLVWTHHVEAVISQIDGSRIANAMKAGLDIQLLGYGEDHFLQARNSIVNGLKAAQHIYGKQVPAADRVVTLGHNSSEQAQALEKVDQVIKAVSTANDLNVTEDEKEQIIAELSAARRLLEASKIRLSALASNLKPALRWLAEKAGGTLVGKAANAAWDFFVGLHWF